MSISSVEEWYCDNQIIRNQFKGTEAPEDLKQGHWQGVRV